MGRVLMYSTAVVDSQNGKGRHLRVGSGHSRSTPETDYPC